MTNWYSVFYWLTVADGLKKFFNDASTVFEVFTIISFILVVGTTWGVAYNISDNSVKNKEQEEQDPDVRSWQRVRSTALGIFYPSLFLCIITWFLYVAIPTKKDALIIIAGGAVGNFVTRDSSSKQLPAEVMNLLRVKIKDEIRETTLKSVLQSNEDTLKNKTTKQLKAIIAEKNKQLEK